MKKLKKLPSYRSSRGPVKPGDVIAFRIPDGPFAFSFNLALRITRYGRSELAYAACEAGILPLVESVRLDTAAAQAEWLAHLKQHPSPSRTERTSGTAIPGSPPE